MVETIELVTFNDLYVIAVGLSATYIIVESAKNKMSFFSFLSQISIFVQNWLLMWKTKPQQEEEALISRIDYYLNSNLLSPETIGALRLVSNKAKDDVKKIKDLEKQMQRKIEFHTKADFLSIASFDCFILGLFVLFIGAFQKGDNINGFVCAVLIAMAVFLLHCLVFERLEMTGWKKYFKPTIFMHSLLWIVVLCCGFSFEECNTLPISCGWLTIGALLGCFAGFISYLIVNILSNIVLLVYFIIRIFSLNINSHTKLLKRDIERYRNELDNIENTLSQERLSESTTISVEATTTQNL